MKFKVFNLLKFITFIILLNKTTAYKFPSLNSLSEVNDLAIGLSAYIEKVYLKQQSQLTVIKSLKPESSPKFSDLFVTIIQNLRKEYTVQIEDAATAKPLGSHRRRSNVFFIDSLESFRKILPILNYANFKMRKLFTVVSINSLTHDEMSEIFKLFNDRLIVTVNLISQDANKIVNLFTFNPNRSLLDCANTNPIKINSFDGNWESDKFEYRKTNDMNGCPLRIGAAAVAAEPAVMHRNKSNGETELLGIEKDIFVELARRLNFTPNFIIYFESVGSIYDNGSANGVLGRVLKNEADVAIGFVSLQLLRTIVLSETSYYSMHSLAMISKLINKLVIKW